MNESEIVAVKILSLNLDVILCFVVKLQANGVLKQNIRKSLSTDVYAAASS